MLCELIVPTKLSPYNSLNGCNIFLSIVELVTPNITFKPSFPTLSRILLGIVYNISK